jgi:ribonucleoside-diphosphate reductase alpha chain
VSENAASKSLEVLKQVASTGYMRKRVPQEFTVLQGGAGATAFGTDANAALAMLIPETRGSSFAETTSAYALGTATTDARTKAKLQGYTGDSCSECGNFTMVRNGSCLKCNSCGATTGCS